jgi:hypothetical protein
MPGLQQCRVELIGYVHFPASVQDDNRLKHTLKPRKVNIHGDAWFTREYFSLAPPIPVTGIIQEIVWPYETEADLRLMGTAEPEAKRTC